MLKLKERKYSVALKMARALGFKSLNDFHTIITKHNFYTGLCFLRCHRNEILGCFKEKRLQHRLKRRLKVDDCIRIFRSLCRDNAVRRGVFSKKVNCYVNGIRTSRYTYKLMR